MSKSKFGALWREGKTVWGAWLMLGNSITAEMVGYCGYDYVCIDTQHGLIDYTVALGMLQALNLANTVPLVRVGANSEQEIGKFLDAGAMGIIIPQVNAVEDAERAVEAVFYPPRGKRSFGPMRPSLRQGMSYYQNVNNEVVVIPQIETAEALDNLELILALPRIDMIYVGPADLRISMGLSPAMDGEEPEFVEAIDLIVRACQEADVIPAIHAENTDLCHKREDQGFRMITAVADFGMLQAGMKAQLHAVKNR